MRSGMGSRKSWSLVAVLLFAIALIASACGGGDDDDGGSSGGGNGTDDAAAGTPTPGGSVTYGLEAENPGGWCLPEAQLDISGIQVARTIYDTLTIPNETGEYVGMLAESYEASADQMTFTFKLRPGVKFHDGSALDSTVVKNNIDAYRGTYPARSPLLFSITLKNIADVTAPDPMTVVVTTKTPWPALPAYMYGSGRLGIMAQAQLDDAATCDTKLIGTGPFKLKEWQINDHLTGEKNKDYWMKDSAGEALPYLEEIIYKPIPDGPARWTALQSGDITMEHDSGAATIAQMREAKEAGQINLTATNEFTEVAYGMFNMSKPPFNSLTARQAVAASFDADAYNEVRNQGLFEMASGPFAPGEVGYLEDAGFPAYDLDEAKKLVAQYQQETGQPLEFTITSTTDSEVVKNVQYVQELGEKAGMKITTKTVEQAALINTALGGDWQAITWRNHPGGNPDGQYVWWHSGEPTNFGKINDPELDALLEQGRAEADPAKQKTIYEDVNRVFGKQIYNLWFNWSEWNIATATDIFGIYGPDNADGSKPFPGLATGHSVAGLWVQQ